MTNTVTVGKVNIDLEEPGYPGNDSDEVKNVIPNQEVVKDPQIENTGINDALVFLRVEIPQETYTDEDDGTWKQKKQDLFRLKDISDQWELLRTETITDADGKEKTSYVYGYKKALAKNSTTDKLFQKVQMKNAMESDLNGNVEDIVVTACAIQATDIPDIDFTPGSDGTIGKDVLDQVYEIFLKQSGDTKARPADEGNKPQNASIGKITYELNGGTIKGAKKSYTAADYGYTPPAPTKKNYTFTGWEPENIPAGSTGNVTLTAKWTPAVLGSISYNLNGGSLTDKKTSYTVEDYGYTPPAPTKENYTFDRWSPASIPSGSTGTVTLTAKWTADVLGNLSYNLDGGSISGEKASYTAEDYGYTPPTPTKKNYTFNGWSPASVPSGSTGNITLTAKWTADVLGDISYNLNGGSLTNQKTSYTVEDYGYVPPTPTKKNYTFTGWEPENIPAGSTGNVTLTAKWTPTVLGSISYNLSGGSLANQKTSYTVEDYGYTPPTPTKKNYTFNGWSPTSIPSGSTGTVTLTAKWTADVLGNISYNLNGGSLTNQKTSYTADDYGYTPPTPTKTGYKFTGWSPTQIQANSTGNVTFAASWKEQTATLLSGSDLNAKMKKLAGGYTTSLSTITAIEKSNTEPDSAVQNSNYVVSTTTSDCPIYMWFDNGTIKWWSEAKIVYANSSLLNMCNGMYNLQDISGLSTWNTSNTTNMQGVFELCKKLTSVSAIRNWDTSKVTTMHSLFSQCSVLTDISALSNWNISSLTNILGLFNQCYKLSDFSAIKNWNVSKITNMRSTFAHCSAMTNFDAISNWNVSSVTNMYGMFTGCTKITNLNGISKWNVSKVTDMKFMFQGCTAISNASGINDWDITSVNKAYFKMMFSKSPSVPTFSKRAGTWNSSGTFTPTS